jgi:uncharacterized protein (DUF934 family)
MALLERQGDGAAIIADRFKRVEDDEGLPTSGGVLVSLARFESEKATLLERDGELGVWLKSDESPAALAGDLENLDLIALDFPVFSDGRAFSSARLLRERYGYTGELRAMGDVLCEQLPFMLRSGFDTFEMASEKAVEEFKAVISEVRVVYQPTGDGRATAIDSRRGRVGRD